MRVELQKSTVMVMTAPSSRKSRSGCALALLDGPANSAPFEREHTVFLSSFLISNRVLFDLGSRFPFMLAPRYPLQPRKLPTDFVYSWTENFLPSSSGQRTRRSRSGRSSGSGADELLYVCRRLNVAYWVGRYRDFCLLPHLFDAGNRREMIKWCIKSSADWDGLCRNPLAASVEWIALLTLAIFFG